MPPFKLKRRSQWIDTLLEERNYLSRVAFNPYPGTPPAGGMINDDDWIDRPNLRVWDHPKNLMQAGQDNGAIFAPLIGVAWVDQTRNAGPISRLQSVQESLGMATNLAFGTPKPHQKDSDDNSQTKPEVKAVSEANCQLGHTFQTFRTKNGRRK